MDWYGATYPYWLSHPYIASYYPSLQYSSSQADNTRLGYYLPEPHNNPIVHESGIPVEPATCVKPSLPSSLNAQCASTQSRIRNNGDKTSFFNRAPGSFVAPPQSNLHGNGNAQSSAVNYKDPFKGSEDVQANQKPFMNVSPSVSSLVDAMHTLSQALVCESFNNGSSLKLEQVDKIVDNLNKCLKRIGANKTITKREASLPTQSSCSNAAKAPNGVASLDSSGFKGPVDKNEMTKSIKDALASNFPEGEETNSQTLLYKRLRLQTEAAALCSKTCMTLYHRIKKEIATLKKDESTFVLEPSLNPHDSVPVLDNAEQEATEQVEKSLNSLEIDSDNDDESSDWELVINGGD